MPIKLKQLMIDITLSPQMIRWAYENPNVYLETEVEEMMLDSFKMSEKNAGDCLKYRAENAELKQQLLHCFDKDEYIKYIQEQLKKQAEEIKLSCFDLYHQLEKGEVWSVGNDIVCDMCEELVMKKLEKYLGGEKE